MLINSCKHVVHQIKVIYIYEYLKEIQYIIQFNSIQFNSIQFNSIFIYIAHLKTTMVDQSASQCPEKLPHKQNEYSKTSQCLNSTQNKSQGIQVRLKNDLKIPTLWAVLMCTGKLFHNLGATTEKARSPLFFNLALGTSRSTWLDDLSALTGVWTCKSSDK